MKDIKTIKGHDWSDEDIISVEVSDNQIYINGVMEDDYGDGRGCGFYINDEDLAVIAKARGFELNKVEK